jgi:Protein of unknown function (DUF732)
MFLRVATLIAAASATAAIVSAAPDAHADPQTQDQQFLNTVHWYGVEGLDDTLKKYAHQFCTIPTGVLPARRELYAQGVVRPEQFYYIKAAASRAYCPDKIAVPPTSK